jgi:hypothetical protein
MPTVQQRDSRRVVAPQASGRVSSFGCILDLLRRVFLVTFHIREFLGLVVGVAFGADCLGCFRGRYQVRCLGRYAERYQVILVYEIYAA